MWEIVNISICYVSKNLWKFVVLLQSIVSIERAINDNRRLFFSLRGVDRDYQFYYWFYWSHLESENGTRLVEEDEECKRWNLKDGMYGCLFFKVLYETIIYWSFLKMICMDWSYFKMSNLKSLIWWNRVPYRKGLLH